MRQPLIFYIAFNRKYVSCFFIIFAGILKKMPVMIRQTILRVIYVLIAIIAIASVIAYFVLVKDRKWMAFYIACCGGLMIVNLIIVIIFVRKNLKK